MKIKIGVLATLVAVLKTKVKVVTFNDYELIKKVADVLESHNNVFMEKHVKGVDASDPAANADINKAWESYEVDFEPPFTKEELHSKIDGIEMSFDERAILELHLIK